MAKTQINEGKKIYKECCSELAKENEELLSFFKKINSDDDLSIRKDKFYLTTTLRGLMRTTGVRLNRNWTKQSRSSDCETKLWIKWRPTNRRVNSTWGCSSNNNDSCQRSRSSRRASSWLSQRSSAAELHASSLRQATLRSRKCRASFRWKKTRQAKCQSSSNWLNKKSFSRRMHQFRFC